MSETEKASFAKRAKNARGILQSQKERDACAVILRELRRMSPAAREHWVKYQLALCDQMRKREVKRSLTLGTL